MKELSIKDEAEIKIAAYNREIERLMRERRQLMDNYMSVFADVQVGEDAYSLDGRYLGTVRELYRINQQTPIYDTSMSVHYRFEDGSNTSSQNIFCVISKAEYERRKLRDAKELVAKAGNDRDL